MLDFINQTNDRDSNVLDFHHPSQITKAMDFSLPNSGLPLEQIVADCREALRYFYINLYNHFIWYTNLLSKVVSAHDILTFDKIILTPH